MPDKTILFEDGAASDGHEQHDEPPVDQWEMLARRRAYLLRVIDLETKAWVEAKNEYVQQARQAVQFSNLPGPPGTAVRDLERGRDRIREWRRQLATILERLAQHPDAIRERKLDEQRIRARQAMAQLGQRISDIVLDDGPDLPAPAVEVAAPKPEAKQTVAPSLESQLKKLGIELGNPFDPADVL
jgi:hypothetical protein